MSLKTAESAGTQDSVSEIRCLPDLLLREAIVRPDSPAVTHHNQHLTFAELVRHSRSLGAYLGHLGVGPDDCVGIFVHPSLDLMVGAWGVLFSGGAYLPLSPEYPEARLRYMIEDSQTRVIFCQEALRTRLAELAPSGTEIVTLQDAAHYTDSLPEIHKFTDHSDVRPEHLAYVIYTSGSTGKPKGVMIDHRAIVNQMCWLNEAHGISRDKVILHKTPMSFDAAQWEILAPCCGSKVIVGAPELYRDTEALIETIVAHDVTTLQCVPTLLRALIDTGDLIRCVSLTQIFSGGEALSRSLAMDCMKAMPQCDLVNLYGPTECTINASAFTVNMDLTESGPPTIPIGTPVANTRYYILDDERKPVPVGEVGELHISGVQLARGYLRRPELTRQRFIENPYTDDPQHRRLFKTGDLASWTTDDTVQFVGRVDNQVKLRGFRVELDEISSTIEVHNWVKRAAVIVKDNPRSGFQTLIACVELDPKEAFLMDQGNHGEHHQSKQSKLQVRAQLSNPGLRETGELAGRPVVTLPGRTPTSRQRREVFARKTYRFFEGGQTTKSDLLRLLRRQVRGAVGRSPATLKLAELGVILRYFGQFQSDERLLPKYGYASPGALYATQMYVEATSLDGLPSGCYYYHPAHHELVLIGETSSVVADPVKIHFMGKNRAIEPVYKNNIQEVLEIETGHMVGLFEEILPRYGLNIESLEYSPAIRATLDCADDDRYLGTFRFTPWLGQPSDTPVDIYLQAHPDMVTDLPAGQYRYRNGDLHKISDELILRNHVIAINQQVYEHASLGVTVVSRAQEEWLRYIDLGRALQHLSMNDVGLGFMSSGYSSKTGNPLPSARRIDSILSSCGLPTGPSYFFVGGRVSKEQRRSEGMKEDIVHMRGPAEIIREDLMRFLPDYMIPNKVVVLDALPLTANGKIDSRALIASDKTSVGLADRPFIAPRTDSERRLAEIWKGAMKRDEISIGDDFFELGGNSLIGVALINRINREFRGSLPLQVLFECSTIERLARRLNGTVETSTASRLVPLWSDGRGNPVFCWPGLGGYTMNLRLLAGRALIDRPFYGIQAYGINQEESPYSTIRQMAAEDLREIRLRQPVGPYTLLGYSFGSRVAFEVTHQLEQAGEQVENLILIAPGSPKVDTEGECISPREADFSNKEYLTVLFSVFAGRIADPHLPECLRVSRDEISFVSFISQRFDLDPEFVARVTRVVNTTYTLKDDLSTLTGQQVHAPVTVFTACGDHPSFIEDQARCREAPAVINLNGGHYDLLKEPDVDRLVTQIRRRLGIGTQEALMPHVNIKHFPAALTDEQQAKLVAAVTDAVKNAFKCDEQVISIALEPVAKEMWHDRVYLPEIVGRKELLRKSPSY